MKFLNWTKYLLLALLLVYVVSCNKDDSPVDSNNDTNENVDEVYLTVFFINDNHGSINNFSKIKYIVDSVKQENEVLLLNAGDMFSGNPVVDFHEDKGYPVIHLMNEVGFDVALLGNHEYDYGQEALKARMEQAEFEWVCANVDMSNTDVPNPEPYVVVEKDSIEIAILGLTETYGKEGDIIPSTHPWRVNDIVFDWPFNVVGQYANLKADEDVDVYIALTHLGYYEGQGGFSDYHLANQYPYFDLIVGGHSHSVLNKRVNNIPVVQAGSYLNYLGKADLKIEESRVVSYSCELIDLNSFSKYDASLQEIIDEYNDAPFLEEVVGFAHSHHSKAEVGCFYTEALMQYMDVDFTLQNGGGIRSDLDEGDITTGEIYKIDPFNNGSVIYQLTVAEIKNILKTGEGFNYAGINITQDGGDVVISDMDNNILQNDDVLTLGINDYVPAVYENYFPDNGEIQHLTTAETLIEYLKVINDQVDYEGCNRYFKYQN